MIGVQLGLQNGGIHFTEGEKFLDLRFIEV